MRMVVLSSAAMLLSWQAYAQPTSKTNKLSFGFSAGLNYSYIRANGLDHTMLRRVQMERGAGFELGLLAAYRMTKNLSVRTRPALAFNAASVIIDKVDNTREKYLVQPTIDLPLHVIYTVQATVVKPYILLGARYRLPIALDDTRPLRLPATSLDIGIGAERVFPRFRFAPELVYSYGLASAGNVPGVMDVRLNTLSLVFNFRN